MFSTLRYFFTSSRIPSNVFKSPIYSLACPPVRFSSHPRPVTITYRDRLTSKPNQDIVLYQYDNHTFFKRLKLFAVFQYIVWFAFGYNNYQIIKEQEKNSTQEFTKDTAFLDSPSGRAFSKWYIIVSTILGTALFAVICFYIKRSVHKVVLKKNGKFISLQTFDPIYNLKDQIFPLSQISGVRSRSQKKGMLPLKVKNHAFYFLLDLEGNFKNPEIFDITVNMKRDLK